MRQDVLDFLRAVVEGRSPGEDWQNWFRLNEQYFQRVLSRGRFLRLKFHPLTEAKSILTQYSVPFEASEAFEWLDSFSTSDRCRICGETLMHNAGGWAWCPKGCFVLMT
jgi:hypothetical protein